MSENVFTLETRIPVALSDKHEAALSQYASVFSKANIAFFSQWKKAGFKAAGMPNKSAFQAKYGITSRQFNAVKTNVKAMVDSHTSNLDRRISELSKKLSGYHEMVAKKVKYVAKLKQSEDDKWLKQRESLKGMKSRQQRLLARYERLKVEKKNKVTSICFGSKAFFLKRQNIHPNNAQAIAQWRTKWEAKRQAQFFSVGSKDEKNGNQSFTLIPQGNNHYHLRVRLPTSLEDAHGKYLLIENLRFPYMPDIIENALKVKAGKIKDRDTEHQTALTYRFIKDDKGWRIQVATVVVKDDAMSAHNGTLGVDFNHGFVSATHVNQRGQKVASVDIPYTTTNLVSSKQNKTGMQLAAKAITDYAQQHNVDIVIESLDFKGKKGAMQKRAGGNNRMLSQLSYASFRQALSYRAFKFGIAMHSVNPANTSILGRIKYLRETKNNSHQAAALVIARLGLSLEEKIPSVIHISHPSGKFAALPTPEDVSKERPQMLKVLNEWVKEKTKQVAEDRSGELFLGKDPFPC